MSYGTSDSTVISPITTEAHNLNTVNASAAQRDDGSPATFPTHTPKNRHNDRYPASDLPLYALVLHFSPKQIQLLQR